MRDVQIITDPAQLKALSDPQRLAIVKTLIEAPCTITAIAKGLGVKRSQLYYHLSQLEELGLVEVVETRQKRNLIEKYYRAVARLFTIDRSLFAQVPDGLAMFMDSVTGLLNTAQLDIQRLVDQGQLTTERIDQVVQAHRGFSIPVSEIPRLRARLSELLDEFSQEGGDHPTVTMALLIYPTPHNPGHDDDNDDDDL